jgi:hypothetical protein
VQFAAPVLLGVFLLAISFTSLAEAKSRTVPADLRVVDSGGRSLADGTQFSGPPTTIKTSRKADCFGPGTGGSGARVEIPKSTALGQLAAARGAFPHSDPLAVTDAFDFGLGLCGIGRAVAPATGFWYLKVNHVASLAGGEQTPVRRGDEVLWYLIADFTDPTPDELVLKAPSSADPGEQVRVRVLSYADDGTRSAAAGAQVSGASGLTDAGGRATITAADGVSDLRATRAGSIPSNTVALCTDRPAKCPAGYARTVGGTPRSDKITGDAEAETILAGAGKDKINCGPGKDRLVLAKGSKSKVRSCEKVSFR